ncbi:hypothetical protein [Roseivirga sp. 4D4]|uniref:hypothetical protein n=1 Tax=Roseivirga sp. 4D4 TaxID=1889784 RepID=UPI001112FD5A|nr:hypothetical protein [Roseivirga sp. 4D4]
MVLLLLCGSLQAQQLEITPIKCSVSEEEVDEIRRRLSFQKNFFRKQLMEFSEEKVTVKVFGDYADFSEYELNCCGMENITTAFFNGNRNEVVVFKNEEFIRSLSHEMSHALLSGKPIEDHFWLSEGLADLLASYKPTDSGKFNAEPMYFAEDLKLNEKSTRKLTRFLSVEADEWRELTTYDSYGVSWALVNYLYSEEPILLREIIQALEGDQSIEKIMASRYKKGMKGFFQLVRGFYAK